MSKLEYFNKFFSCPSCHDGALRKIEKGVLECEKCKSEYPFNSGRPILLDPNNQLFSIDSYRDLIVPSLNDKPKIKLSDILFSPSVNSIFFIFIILVPT